MIGFEFTIGELYISIYLGDIWISKMNNRIQCVFINKFKKVLTFILIIILLLVVSIDLFTYVAFKLNQDFIAEVLCINKDKPKLKCDGNCYLNKELKKNNGNESKKKTNFPTDKQDQKNNFYAKLLTLYIDYPKTTNNQICKNQIRQSYLITTDIFHPPRIRLI